MRIKVKEPIKEGDIRIIEQFALFPIRTGNQLIWLEKVKVKQKAKRFIDMSCGYSEIKWVDIEIIIED